MPTKFELELERAEILKKIAADIEQIKKDLLAINEKLDNKTKEKK